MFIQPDWFDAMQPGVGTNRFSYSFNDPINKADQNGNCGPVCVVVALGEILFGSGAATTATTVGAASIVELSTDASDGNLNGSGVFATSIRNATASLGGDATGKSNGTLASTASDSPSALAIREAVSQSIGYLTTGQQYAQAKTALAKANVADPAKGQKTLDRYLALQFDGTGTHGNSLQSPNENQLYHLVDIDTLETTKIGITSDLKGGRYTDKQLKDMNSRYDPRESYPNRLSARQAEVGQTMKYVIENGRFPKYTFTC